MIAYVNGRLIPREKATISIDDHGFLYGDGIYETLRVYNGKIFRANDHLKRLKHSADGIGLKLPLSLKAIARAMEKTVKANRHTEAVVRLTVTRGPGPYGFDPRPCTHPSMVIVSYPFKAYPTEFHQKGIPIGVVSIRRNNPVSLPPHVKSTSCMNGVLAKMESIKLKAFEGVMLTYDGFLSEGTVSNIFIVKNKVVKTPALVGTLLAGVTRGHVLRLAKKLGYEIQEARLRLADLTGADEAFLSNTTMEVMPIRKIIISGRAKTVQKAAPGPVTSLLMKSFRNGTIPAL